MFLSVWTPKKCTSIGIKALATLLAKLPLPKHNCLTKIQNHPIKNPCVSSFMPSMRKFWKELTLIDINLISLNFLRLCYQNDEFSTWFSHVEQAIGCQNLSDREKFKVVISKLWGCGLQWWKNYKFKRRTKGKEKVRTWKELRGKLRGKLTGAFCPLAYKLKHVSLLPKKNGWRPEMQEHPFQ